MNRTFLLFLLAIFGAALLGLLIAEEAGYVLIAWKGFRYESTLWVFLALGAAVWALVASMRLLLGLVGASGRLVNPWSGRNRARRVQQAAQRGLLELAAGRWSHALRLLRRAAEHSTQPLVAYLAAARAASELGEYATADELLERARLREPKAALAVDLTLAQLLMARGEDERAVATLEVIHERQPRHPHALRLLQQLYQRQGNWAALCALLPDLRRQRLLKDDELEALELRARRALLEQAAHGGEAPLEALHKAWQQMPQAQRQMAGLVACYAEQLQRLGAEVEAEEVLHAALKREYDARLAYRYGLVQGRDPARQLASAEAWLKGHPGDAGLLLSLGRLALRNQLWGKARDYFEHSLQLERSVETYGELARLLVRLGEVERSNRLLQEGFGLLGSELPVLPQPGR
jgi:HemY protein